MEFLSCQRLWDHGDLELVGENDNYPPRSLFHLSHAFQDVTGVHFSIRVWVQIMFSQVGSPEKSLLPFERYRAIPPPRTNSLHGQTGLETHTSSAPPRVSFQGLTITSPALGILQGTVFTAFLSTFGRAQVQSWGNFLTKRRPLLQLGCHRAGKELQHGLGSC